LGKTPYRKNAKLSDNLALYPLLCGFPRLEQIFYFRGLANPHIPPPTKITPTIKYIQFTPGSPVRILKAATKNRSPATIFKMALVLSLLSVSLVDILSLPFLC
jgi:hypothetical protein